MEEDNGFKRRFNKSLFWIFKSFGCKEEDIDISDGSAIEIQAEFIKEAIANFLTKVEFKITELKAPVVVEDFNIPPQSVDILPQVTYIPYPGGAPGPGVPLQNGKDGANLPTLDLDKSSGALRSTGYVYIGEDPDSQDSFDVDDENGQREFTKVKLFREDIEELL